MYRIIVYRDAMEDKQNPYSAYNANAVSYTHLRSANFSTDPRKSDGTEECWNNFKKVTKLVKTRKTETLCEICSKQE